MHTNVYTVVVQHRCKLLDVTVRKLLQVAFLRFPRHLRLVVLHKRRNAYAMQLLVLNKVNHAAPHGLIQEAPRRRLKTPPHRRLQASPHQPLPAAQPDQRYVSWYRKKNCPRWPSPSFFVPTVFVQLLHFNGPHVTPSIPRHFAAHTPHRVLIETSPSHVNPSKLHRCRHTVVVKQSNTSSCIV